MVSGPKVVIPLAVIVAAIATFTITEVIERQDGASDAFIHQMAAEPRCNILTAPGVGVRRQGVLALATLHPDWGFDAERLTKDAGRMDVAGAGELPGSTPSRRLGWVEVGWPMAGGDKGEMEGMRARCEADLVVGAVPITLPLGGERLRSQGTVLLPPTRAAFPAEAATIPLVGDGTEGLLWRERCAPAEGGGARCAVDAYNPRAPGWFVPILTYQSHELQPPQAPTREIQRRVTEGRATAGQLELLFVAEEERATLSGGCPQGEAWVGEGAAEAEDGCEVRRETVKIRCACGPWPVGITTSSGLAPCRRVEGPEDAEALCRGIPLPPVLDEP